MRTFRDKSSIRSSFHFRAKINHHTDMVIYRVRINCLRYLSHSSKILRFLDNIVRVIMAVTVVVMEEEVQKEVVPTCSTDISNRYKSAHQC